MSLAETVQLLRAEEQSASEGPKKPKRQVRGHIPAWKVEAIRALVEVFASPDWRIAELLGCTTQGIRSTRRRLGLGSSPGRRRR